MTLYWGPVGLTALCEKPQQFYVPHSVDFATLSTLTRPTGESMQKAMQNRHCGGHKVCCGIRYTLLAQGNPVQCQGSVRQSHSPSPLILKKCNGKQRPNPKNFRNFHSKSRFRRQRRVVVASARAHFICFPRNCALSQGCRQQRRALSPFSLGVFCSTAAGPKETLLERASTCQASF